MSAGRRASPGQLQPVAGDPRSSHLAWSSMRTGIFAMQGLREIFVGAITSQLAESIDKNVICLTCVPGYAANRPRNPAKLLPI